MAEYRLDVGDILEISSASAPELRSRVRVQMDGSVSVPIMGRLDVAGLTLSQIQEAIRGALATKVVRQRGADGREAVFLIQPDDVAAAVAEFRPVYVMGDVTRPGEQAYRPNMTVQQAIAVSGGLEVARYRATHPTVEAADLKGEYESLWIEMARRHALIWRIRRELGGSENLDEAQMLAMPVETALVRRLIQTERNALESRANDFKLERDYFKSLVRQADQQIAILSDQREKEEQGREADVADLTRAQEMLGRGALTSQRVTEARRAVLLSSTRRLQTDVQLTQLQRQRAEANSSLERIEGQRRIRLNQELAEADSGLATTRARLEAVGEKLAYIGLLRATLRRAEGGETEIRITRRNARIKAPDDFVLMPGDVVEVALLPTAPREPPSKSAAAD